MYVPAPGRNRLPLSACPDLPTMGVGLGLGLGSGRRFSNKTLTTLSGSHLAHRFVLQSAWSTLHVSLREASLRMRMSSSTCMCQPQAETISLSVHANNGGGVRVRVRKARKD